uniref:Uncharacterized protein n=1 Tax=Anguilla anguilla TaxID=7936 RepID=A0A0E9VDH8_ANGAN
MQNTRMTTGRNGNAVNGQQGQPMLLERVL